MYFFGFFLGMWCFQMARYMGKLGWPFLPGLEVGISQSVAPREPSECLVPAPASPCLGGRVRIGWDPKPMPNFFGPKVGSVVQGVQYSVPYIMW